MSDLIQRINYWNDQLSGDQEIEHNFDLTIGPAQKLNGMHPSTFGAGVFDKEFDQIIDMMPVKTAIQRSNRDQMQGQFKFIKNCIYNKKDYFINDVEDINDSYDIFILKNLCCIIEYKQEFKNIEITDLIDNKEKQIIKNIRKK
jgi:hypothetical protein